MKKEYLALSWADGTTVKDQATVSEDDDCDDKAVETQDTCQDDWNDRLDDEVRSED